MPRILSGAGFLRHDHQRAQQIVEFMLVPQIRPTLLAQGRNGLRVEPAGLAQQLIRNHTAHGHRARPALFQGRIVEEGIGVGIQQLMSEAGGRGGIDRETANRAAAHFPEHADQPIQVHRFAQHVFHHFANQRMIGDLDVAFDVLLASGHLRKHAGQQIVGARALYLRSDSFAVM